MKPQETTHTLSSLPKSLSLSFFCGVAIIFSDCGVVCLVLSLSLCTVCVVCPISGFFRESVERETRKKGGDEREREYQYMVLLCIYQVYSDFEEPFCPISGFFRESVEKILVTTTKSSFIQYLSAWEAF